MSKFFQNKDWIYINKYIYKKPSFELDFFWKKYFWVVKEQKKLGMRLRWYQVLGIEIPDISDETNLKKTFDIISRDFKKSWWDIFFQFWFINNIYSNPSYKLKDESELNKVKELYEEYKSFLNSKIWLIPSIRENMPPANVLVNLDKADDDIFNDISKNTKSQIKKWKSKWLNFEILNIEDLEKFYSLWYKTLDNKSIVIPGREEFNLLYEYITENNVWDIFIAKLDWDIVAGSVCIWDNDTVYYVYWASDRNAWNIWQHQFLKYNMFLWAKEKWFKNFDLLWVSPAWNNNHSLSWVSQFKNSLWWDYINYLWNYDLVFNDTIYKAYNMLKN